MAKLKSLPVQELLNTAYLKITPLRNRYDQLSAIPHRHDHYELIWVIEGHGNHYINFKPYPIIPNRIYLLQKGHVHQIPDFERTGRVILIGEHFIQHFFALHPEEEGKGLFDPFGLTPYIDLTAPIHDDVSSMFSSLDALLSKEGTVRDVVFHLLSALLLLVNENYTLLHQEKQPLLARDRQLLLKFRKLLNDYYDQEHGTTFYTRKIGIHTKTINHVLHQLTKRSMHELIEDKLLSEAKMLLLTTGLNMKQIAFQLGFSDPAYFGRFFKRHTGFSPAHYRADHS